MNHEEECGEVRALLRRARTIGGRAASLKACCLGVLAHRERVYQVDTTNVAPGINELRLAVMDVGSKAITHIAATRWGAEAGGVTMDAAFDWLDSTVDHWIEGTYKRLAEPAPRDDNFDVPGALRLLLQGQKMICERLDSRHFRDHTAAIDALLAPLPEAPKRPAWGHCASCGSGFNRSALTNHCLSCGRPADDA